MAQISTGGPYCVSPTKSSGARYQRVATYSVYSAPGPAKNIQYRMYVLMKIIVHQVDLTLESSLSLSFDIIGDIFSWCYYLVLF